METRISIHEISIFSFFDPKSIEKISKIFKVVELEKDQMLLTYGQEVTGLYILLNGNVDVLNEKMDAQLATLERGSAIGEMSLIEKGQKSSANLRVQSDIVRLIFCDRETFDKFLSESPENERAFYKGASLTLCRRLRQTNGKINFDLNKAAEVMQGVLEESKVLKYLRSTQKGINDTGSNMLGEFFAILPLLEKVCESEVADKAQLRAAKQRIEALALAESQNIDRLAQQLDLISQYFTNIKRVLSGQAPLAIKGDRNIFDEPDADAPISFL